MIQQKRTRIVIVENIVVVRSSLVTFLTAHDDFEVVGEADTTIDAMHVCEQTRPDLVLMNLAAPGMGIIAAIHRLNQAYPEVRVVILSGFGLEKMVKATLAAGAVRFLFKDVTGKELAEAIRATVNSNFSVWDNMQNHTYLDYCRAE